MVTPLELYAVIMVRNSKTLVLMPSVLILVLNISFLRRMFLLRTVLWKERIGRFVRWPGRCSMSIGLLGSIGPRL